MVFLGYLSLAAAIALSGFTEAAPVDASTSAKKSFKIEQVPNPYFKARNGTMSVLKTYRKFRGTLPASLAALASTGSVTATPSDSYDDEYTCPVDIGGQTLNLDFDTGSADLWVFSSRLSSSERSGHSYYTSSSDSSFKTLSGYTWDISYGDGSGASGTVGTTTVEIGGITVTSQAVELATSVSSEFVQDTASDGLVGLAFSTINTVSPRSQNTFFDNALSSLSEPVMVADLKHNEAGTYTFGEIPFTEDITYTNADSSEGYWGFTASVSGTSFSAIADTGTTLLYLPSKIVSSYWSKVSGASYDSSEGGYTFSCSASLPDLTFTVAGTSFTIDGEYMNYGTLSGSTCFGGLLSNEGIGLSIFGDVMFKSVYVVFDLGNEQLGFAQKS